MLKLLKLAVGLAIIAILVACPNFEEWKDKAVTGGPPQSTTPGTAISTGSLATARSGHTSTQLVNGKVLIAGGQGDLVSGFRTPIRTAEIYDASTGVWTPTANLAEARSNHTATQLPNGLVLVAGGTAGNGQTALTSAELYNPANGQWGSTGSMKTSRWGHTATLLPDGRVLVAGGDSNDSPTATCEIFNPSTGQWTVTGAMAARRMNHVAASISNGKVLVAGGFGLPNGANSALSAEIFDPSTGLWTQTGTPISARYRATVNVLDSGRVLVVGGVGNSGVLSSTEVYDQISGIWTASDSLSSARFNHTATLLPSGRVLAIGGGAYNGISPLSSAEIYNPLTGLWKLISTPIVTPRGNHTATLLTNSRVLISGGTITSGSAVTTALSELFWYADAIPSRVTNLSGGLIPGNVNGSLSAASFFSPRDVLTDSSGNLYVADSGNYLIRKITADGTVTTFAGSGVTGSADGLGTKASFTLPLGMAIDSTGNIYVADSNRIRKISSNGNVGTLASTGITGACAVAVDSSQNVFVADCQANKILKITSLGITSIFAGSGLSGSANGQGTAASFNYPSGVSLDSNGNLFVADQNNFLIRKITPAGSVTTFAGSGVQGGVDGERGSASFYNPVRMTIRNDGTIYLVDGVGNKIRQITPSGAVTTLAGTGRPGNDNGFLLSATFNNPRGIAVDSSNNIYIADSSNNTVRKIVALY